MKTEDLQVVAEFAALAPSVHNTQPWRFVSGPASLEIHIDADRGLDYLDPWHRQMLISCGAAAEFGRLGIRSLGVACIARLLPDPSHPTLVAKLISGAAEPLTPAEQRLIDAVPRRYTDRGPYTDEAVPNAMFQTMRETAGERNCWLRVVDRPEHRQALIQLLETAERIESDDPVYRTEIQRWQRHGAAHDGILVDDYADWASQHRMSDVPLRDFSGYGRHDRRGALDPRHVERDPVVVLGSDRDDPLSWLQSGRALADIVLVLTDANLVCQPLGPVLDVPTTREQLRHELGLIGYPQMLLRIGHGHRTPVAGRRAVEDVFNTVTAP
ncbi:MAG TPA: hypothetical protein VHA79_13180 [Mycobacteriales bacterium]|jgi:hypothetical protein|nr:hypothetical protein [Mycobacteriales bacterium]